MIRPPKKNTQPAKPKVNDRAPLYATLIHEKIASLTQPSSSQKPQNPQLKRP